MTQSLPADVARVLIQALEDAGCSRSAQSLAVDAGLAFSGMQPADTMRAMIVSNAPMESVIEVFNTSVAKKLDTQLERHVRLALEQCRFTELIQSGQRSEALSSLQFRITPLSPNAESVRSLAASLFTSATTLTETSGKDYFENSPRAVLIQELESILPANVMLSGGRLCTLMGQAYAFQASQCPVHAQVATLPDGSARWPSDGILEDHKCDVSGMQYTLVRTLSNFGDEVIHLSFSPDGRRLASAGSAGVARIWDMNTGALVGQCSLSNENSTVQPARSSSSVRCVAWNADGSALVACGALGEVRMWDAETGLSRSLVRDPLGSAVTALCWVPAVDRAAAPSGRILVPSMRASASQSDHSSDDASERAMPETRVLQSDIGPAPTSHGAIVVASEAGHLTRLSVLRENAPYFGVESHTRMVCRGMAYVRNGGRPALLTLDQAGQVHTMDAHSLLPVQGVSVHAALHGIAATERNLPGAAPDFLSIRDYTAMAASDRRVALLSRPVSARLNYDRSTGRVGHDTLAQSVPANGAIALVTRSDTGLLDLESSKIQDVFRHTRMQIHAAFSGEDASFLVVGGEGTMTN